MITYHGTSSANASYIVAGTVDVICGGGELGRGFYTGQFCHEAKAWAFHVSRNKKKNVVMFETSDNQIDALDYLIFDRMSAQNFRNNIRRAQKTRTYVFNVDMVWAPIVGSTRVSGEQNKWESISAQKLLNGADTIRTVI